MAKSILHLQEILVVAQDPRAGNLLRSGVGSQQIEAVADLLGLDHLDPAAPLQLTVWVHGIVKVFMGFEPLQRASHLAPPGRAVWDGGEARSTDEAVNSGGGKGPQLKDDARSSEGQEDWR